LTLAIGGAVFAFAQIIAIVPGNLVDLCYKVVNLLATPLGGLVLCALLIPRATRAGLLTGTAASMAAVVYVTYLSPFTFLLAAPAGLSVHLISVFLLRSPKPC
jgi:Na+/proline symporter